MGPRNPEPALHDELCQTLNDPALRGEDLIDAVTQLGARHAVEPFRALLGYALSLDCPESEARRLVSAIEAHRAVLQGLLGRDPGFSVAACDLLHERDRTVRDPVFREMGASVDALPRPDDIEPDPIEALRQETARAGRSGRFLAVALLGLDRSESPDESPAGELAALRDGARDVDRVIRLGPGEYAVLMPCTAGRQGLRGAERLARALAAASGAKVTGGVAAAAAGDARVLLAQARRALQEARRDGADVVLFRAERRAHPRLQPAGGLGAHLRTAGDESEVRVEDLSLGGALVCLPRRLDPGGDASLVLRGLPARPSQRVVPSRVLRVLDGPRPGVSPWRAALEFGREARIQISAVLAEMAPPPTGEKG